MNEETEQQIQNFLEKMNNTSDIAISEAPTIIQDMLYWHFVLNGIGSLFGFLLILCMGFLLLKTNKIYDDVDRLGTRCIIGFITAIITFATSVGLIEVFKVYTSPKLVILEEFTRLLK